MRMLKNIEVMPTQDGKIGMLLHWEDGQSMPFLFDCPTVRALIDALETAYFKASAPPSLARDIVSISDGATLRLQGPKGGAHD